MSAEFDDLVQNVDDLSQALDDTNQSLSDYSDQNDENVSDLQNTTSDLSETSGQLTFPLTEDTTDLIRGVFPTGFATLSAGTATVINPNVSPTSTIFLTYAKINGTPGVLSYTASIGSFSIQSTQLVVPAGVDSSIVDWVIFN